MSSRNNLVFLFLTFVFSTNLLYGQIGENGLFVTVEVNDVDADVLIYSGYISEGTNQDTLYLLTKSDNVIQIPTARIISMKSEQSELKKENNSPSKTIPERNENKRKYIPERRVVYKHEKGLYFNLGFDASFQTSDFFDIYGGAEAVVGYKFSQYAYIGAGFGYRAWTYDVWPAGVGTVFGEIRGYFLEKDVSPYYRLRVGYGNSWHGGEGNFRSSNGGLFVSPSIGIRLIDGALFHMNIETGLHHQEIDYIDLEFGSFERQYTFNRHFIGLSFMYK